MDYSFTSAGASNRMPVIKKKAMQKHTHFALAFYFLTDSIAAAVASPAAPDLTR